MKINLHNFGAFEAHENVWMEMTHNDGRYVVHETKPEWWDMSLKGGHKIAAHHGAAIKELNADGDYGWTFGETVLEALEEYFRIASENGLGVAEVEE